MDWSTLLIFPVIVGIIILLIEYFVIQPIRKSNSEIPLPANLNRDWTNAIRKAVKEFKAQQVGYDSETAFNKDQSGKLKVEECTVQKGRAILIISLAYIGVIKNNLSSGDVTEFYVIKKYRLEVIRTGEILKSTEIETKQTLVRDSILPPGLSNLNTKPKTANSSSGTAKLSHSGFDFQRLQELTNYAHNDLSMTKRSAAQWAEKHYDYFEKHDFEKYKKLVSYAYKSLGMTKLSAAQWAFHNMEKISL